MKKSVYLFLLFIIAFSQCSEKETFILPETIKLYYKSDDAKNNGVAFDIFSIPSGFAIFSTNTNTGDKFDAEGELRIWIVNQTGEMQNEMSILVGSGFPVNAIETETTFEVIWNFAEGVFKTISIQKNDYTHTIKNLDINSQVAFSASYISRAAVDENNHLLLLGLANTYISSIDSTVKKTFIVSIAPDMKVRTIGEYEYNPAGFGNVGNDELSVLSKLDIYFLLNKKVFAAPVGNKISFRYLGDPEAVFEDREAWMCNFTLLENDKVSIVYNKSKQKDSYYVHNDITLIRTNMSITDFQSPVKLSNINTDEKIFIQQINELGISNIVIGTSASGQISVNVFKDDLSNKTKTIGNSYKYSVAGVVWNASQQMITIVGNTRMEYKYYRTFLMQIPLSELMK